MTAKFDENGDKVVWEPWRESSVWKTRAEFFTWLRGQIRKSIWQNYPPKNEFRASKMRKATEEDYESGMSRRTKKVAQCEFCNNWFGASKLQVDHVKSAGSLRDADDIATFIMNIACMKENMRLACKPCHDVRTYAERMDISFEEARISKQVIVFSKLTTGEQNAILTEAGYSAEDISNATKRKNCYKQILLNKIGENICQKL